MASEWTTTTLGELCEFRAGSVFKPALQGQTSGSYPFVKVSDMNLPANAVRIQDANNWVSEQDLRDLRARPFPAGTVVFAKIGEALRQNRLRQVARETVVDNNMMGAVPRTAHVEPRFFYYALSKFDFSDIAQGTALPYLTISALSGLTLDVPPLAEQRAIAHILGTLDDKIELNRRMNETLEAIARALFHSWFVAFDPVRRNMARKGRGQPSPQTPLPGGEGREESRKGFHYRGGFDFAGLVERARAMRKQQTPAEDVFWELVRDRRVLNLKFRRQHEVGDYIADFYCHEHRLVVELDGGIHSAKRKKDHKRDAWMEAQGFTVLRFSNQQLLDDPASVLAAIAQVVESAAQLLPLPLGEGRGEDGVEGGHPSPFGRRAGDEGVVESHAFDHLFPNSFEDSELGEIPAGWRVGTLGDVAIHPRRGVQPSAIDPTTPYIALEHMPKRCMALSEWGNADRLESNKFEFRKGEILFGKLRPYFHKVGIAPVDGVCSTDIVVVAPHEGRWLGFVLGHVSSTAFVEHTNAGSTGTKMPRTSWAEMARYSVVLPPDAIAEAFTERIHPKVARTLASIHESRTLAALRGTLLPRLISGDLRVNDAERIVEIV